MPAVAWPRSEPRERRQPTGDSGADDGRLPADRENVGSDRAQRRKLPNDLRQSEQPAEAVDAEGEKGDVLPGDGEQMREPGGPKVLPDRLRQPLVLAEDDAQDERALHAVRAPPDRSLDSIAQAIAAARDTTTRADLSPRARACDDVDSLASEPGTLVEAAVLGTSWLGHAHDRFQDGAARRRAADRKHEEHPFSQRLSAKRSNLGRYAYCPRCLPRRPRDDEPHRPRLADLRQERALAHRLEAHRAPAESRQSEQRSERGHARRATTAVDSRQRGQREHDENWTSQRDPVRNRETGAGRAGKHRRPLELDGSPHGVTRSRSCSTRVGPIPGTASRSSTDLKGPCSVR